MWWAKKPREDPNNKQSVSAAAAAAEAEKPYKIMLDPRTKVWKTGVEEKQFKVKFIQEKAGRNKII